MQGPLQAALLARAITDWIGGRGLLVEYAVQNRAVAFAGEELSFGGVVTAKRLGVDTGLVDLDIAGRRGATAPMPGTATVGAAIARRTPRRTSGRGIVTGLRGEAAIIGIAQSPAERKQTRPPSFTLDQYALLAKMVVEDAGVDAHGGQRSAVPRLGGIRDVRPGHAVGIPWSAC